MQLDDSRPELSSWLHFALRGDRYSQRPYGKARIRKRNKEPEPEPEPAK